MKIILAGNYNEFLQYCHDNIISRRDPNTIYARDIHSIKGIHGAEIKVVGTFWERRDASDIFQEAKCAEFK